MSPTLFLSALILVPLMAYQIARRRVPNHVFGITGAAFGAIVAPLGLGLYSWYFLSTVGVIPGFLGLALSAIHEVPGFQLAVNLGLIPRFEVVSGTQQNIVVEAINAVVWSAFYGLLGHAVDYYRRRKRDEKRAQD